MFCLNLRETMHSQLPQDWEDLVRQFYRQTFSVFYKSGGLNTSHDQVDSADWSGDLTCGECGNQTEAFQLTITRMGEMGLMDRMSDQVVLEIAQDKIISYVQETCKESFDCSYLASLEEWLDIMVLA